LFATKLSDFSLYASFLYDILQVYGAFFLKMNLVSKELFEIIFNDIKNTNQFTKIQLGVTEKQTASYYFYKKMGFEEV
jgi:hypothetical protein